MTEELIRAAWDEPEAAARYERARPNYAQKAVDWLATALNIGPGTSVLDLGAGTGKLTRQLAASGADVVAVEPLAGMRAAFAASLPHVPVMDGRAEAIPLPDASVDVVVAGQAWHWFDYERAAAEVARVLRVHGGLGLLWNTYDESVPWLRELVAIRDRYDQPKTPSQYEARWREPLMASPVWTPLQKRAFTHNQTVTRTGVADRLLTTSVFAPLTDPEREAVRAEVLSLLDRHGQTGEEVTVRYVTEVYWTRKRYDLLDNP